MKKSFILSVFILFTMTFFSCDNKSEEEKDLYTPIVPIFNKEDCLKYVHDGDNITITSLIDSKMWEVKPKYLRTDELVNGDFWKAQSKNNQEIKIRWLNIKQTSSNTYIVKIKIENPSDTVRHIQMTAKSSVYNYDNAITFVLQ